MVARRVLIIHPDAERRRELRALLGENDIVEAESRKQAVPLMEGVSVVLSHHADFKRVLKDLERHAPKAVRAVLCPSDEVRDQLVDVAEEYDFITVDETSADKVRALVQSRKSIRRKPTSSLVATFMVGDERFSCAVAEVGNGGLGLTIDPSSPAEHLTPGARLEQASVFIGGTEVMEPRTWLVSTVRGARHGVHVGVVFEQHRPSHAAARIADDVRVRSLIRRAIAHRSIFRVQRTDGSQGCAFPAARLESGRLVLSGATCTSLRNGEIVQLVFELRSRQTESTTAVIAAQPGTLELLVPRTAAQRERRSSLRLRPPPQSAFLVFTSALTGELCRRSVLDLQASGASFSFDSSIEAYPPGLVLSKATLEINGRQLRCEAVVQATAASDTPHLRRCGVHLRRMTEADRHQLREELFRALTPEVSDGGAEAFTALWDLFLLENDTFPDYPPDEPSSLRTLNSVHKAMGSGAHGLGRAFVFKSPEGELLGHASGLRIYSGTWLAQHLVVKSGSPWQMQTSQTLVNLTFDYGEALGDIEYVRGLWRSANRWSSRVFGGVTSKLVRPGLSCMATFWPMRRQVSQPLPPPSSGLQVRPCGPSDVPVFIEHARRTHDTLRLKANDLTEEQLFLDELSNRFGRIGLERSRALAVVEGPNGPRGWVLMEHSSSGLFWAEFYNGFHLYIAEPPGPEADQVRHALIAWAFADAARRGRKIAECLAYEEDVPVLERLGFANLGQVIEYTAHKSLTRDITTHVARVFEKLQVRNQRREQDQAS